VRLGFILLAGVTGGALAAASEPIVTLRPPEELKLKPAEARDAALEITIRDGFHIQANPAANEFLIPLTIAVETTEALSTGAPRYPPPSRYRLEGTDEDLLVYGGVMIVPVPVRALRSTPPGLHTLQGKVKYQACDDRSCRPPATAAFELKIQVLPERAAK
jgi:DsbC/DsbD-like thiol-disulfide interchange protein